MSARLRAREVLNSATRFSVVAGLFAVLLRLAGMGAWPAIMLAALVLCSLVAITGRRHRHAWSSTAAARHVEASRPAHNVVITGEELLRHPDRAAASIRQRVIFEAAEIAGSTTATDVVPLARRAWTAVAVLAVMASAISGVPSRLTRTATQTLQTVSSKADKESPRLIVRATIVAPDYTKEAPRTLEDPERIEALHGSHLTLTIPGRAAWNVRFGTEALSTSSSDRGTVVELPLTQSGYLAIESGDRAAAATRRLLPISVVPDRAPSIRVEKPGKDLLLPNAASMVDLAATATDDFGLQALELRYTKVSGSGEQFEFKEGTLPLSISRASGREWRAQAVLALSRIGLAPGDAMIYRVVGRDARPGEAGAATSDTYFIEIAGPGQVALAGFELPPDRERYALSQQMIVLKLERLGAKERSLDRATLEQEVGTIAAEQRAVRANFIFLMGGQIEDEEAEAEHSHEIQEGRLENTARREIVDAIQHMGKVEIALATIDTGAALPPARAAVEALQRAFGRNRYILRTLPVRSRVDPSKRLTGDVSSASGWRRDIRPLPPDAAAEAARDLLARLLDSAPAIMSDEASAETITALAEQALAIDPAADEWQRVAKGLTQLRERTGTERERTAGLNGVIARVSAAVERGALSTRPAEQNRAMKSALTEERVR